eukprot:14051288-Alexandrium_andersonii.AAC.1
MLRTFETLAKSNTFSRTSTTAIGARSRTMVFAWMPAWTQKAPLDNNERMDKRTRWIMNTWVVRWASRWSRRWQVQRRLGLGPWSSRRAHAAPLVVSMRQLLCTMHTAAVVPAGLRNCRRLGHLSVRAVP